MFDRRENLDTIGRMGKLAFQYAALLRLGELPASEGAIVTHNDVQHELVGTDIEDMRSGFMDVLAEMHRDGGARTMDEFDRCLSALWSAAHEWAEANGREFGV